MYNIGDILIWLGLGGVVIGLIAKVFLKKSPQTGINVFFQRIWVAYSKGWNDLSSRKAEKWHL